MVQENREVCSALTQEALLTSGCTTGYTREPNVLSLSSLQETLTILAGHDRDSSTITDVLDRTAVSTLHAIFVCIECVQWIMRNAGRAILW